MNPREGRPIESAEDARSTEKVLLSHAVAVLMVLVYLTTACSRAVHVPLWLDEVITVWLVRLHGVSAIFQALGKGAQYVPPGYPVLLYDWLKLAGQSYLALRFPSIVAGLVTAIAVYLLLRRYLHISTATLGLSLSLCTPFYTYALQVRPYLATVAMFAIALLLWDRLQRTSRPMPLLAGLVILLSTAISFHFYCVLYLISLGIMELLFASSTRRFRPGVRAALVLSGLSVSFWIPLARQFSKYNRGDQGPYFYGRPTILKLYRSMEVLFSHPGLLIGAAALAVLLLFRAESGWDLPSPQRMRSVRPLLIIALGCSALPFIAFLFARYVSGTYNDRYVLPGALGGILLICVAAEFLPMKPLVLPVTALLVGISSLRYVEKPVRFPDMRKVFAQAQDPYPIVTPEGLFFFQEKGDRKLTPQQKARIVYVTLPANYPFRDRTNENLVLHWLAIDPSLSVYPAQSFLASGRCFHIFDSLQSADELLDYLKAQHIESKDSIQVSGGNLSEVCPATLAQASGR